MYKNQKGFTAVHTLLVILALVLIGGAGWFVWHHNQLESDKQAAAKTAAEAQNKQNNTQPEPKAEQPADPNAGYVVVAEWGVRFKPAEDLKSEDIIVRPEVDAEAKAQGWERHAFSTKAVVGLGGYCKEIAIAMLSRTKSDPMKNDDEIVREQYKATGVKIGEYYYTSTGAQATCTDDPDEKSDQIQVTARSGLTKGLLKLETVKN